MALTLKLKVNRCFALASKYSMAFSKDNQITHTGQYFKEDDYRQSRFVNLKKLVNENFAIDLIKKSPVIVCSKRVVSSHTGKALGHPQIFINLDPPGIHTCGYSGEKFVLKKHYDEKTMGPSITYEEYLKKYGVEDETIY